MFQNNILRSEKQHWISLTFECEIKKGVIKNMEPEKHDRIELFPLHKLPSEQAMIFKIMMKKLKAQGYV